MKSPFSHTFPLYDRGNLGAFFTSYDREIRSVPNQTNLKCPFLPYAKILFSFSAIAVSNLSHPVCEIILMQTLSAYFFKLLSYMCTITAFLFTVLSSVEAKNCKNYIGSAMLRYTCSAVAGEMFFPWSFQKAVSTERAFSYLYELRAEVF